MEKLKWYLKQLLPLRYETTYTEHNGGLRFPKRCAWRMWMGRCFAVEDTIVLGR